MENFRVCCAFGHHEVTADIAGGLDTAISLAVLKGCSVFMTGGNGDFDKLFAAAVRRAKKQCSHIQLELIKPHFSNDWNTHKDYYAELYDRIVVPDELSLVHYKSAITACNRWMIDRSDIVIAFVHRDYGGAYTAVRYARKKNKEIIRVEK